MTNKIYCKKQFSTQFKEYDKTYNIVATALIESLSNQSPYFSLTAEIWEDGKSRNNTGSGGCLHDEIAKHLPKIAKYIKWHLTSMTQPMHYLANSLYWAGFSGYCDGKKDSPPKLDYLKSTCIYGAIESDNNFNIENYLRVNEWGGEDILTNVDNKKILTEWLNNRLPELMNQFNLEMIELFQEEYKEILS